MTCPSARLAQVLRKQQKSFASVVPFNFQQEPFLVFDFSVNNSALNDYDFRKMNAYITEELQKAGANAGIGKYNEERAIYGHGQQFQANDEHRTIHLGLDILMQAGTPIYAPLDGNIHSFQNNDLTADYGPTIILEHQLEDILFYTLYGHLSIESLEDKEKNQIVPRGKQIATLGAYDVNGGWLPHLHFQIITDMQGQQGDFIGVAPKSKRDHFLSICPDPNLILGIPI